MRIESRRSQCSHPQRCQGARAQAQIPLSYLRPDQLAAWGQPGLGFDEREPAAAFVQSNCKVPSGRTELIANLMSFGDVPVHSYGKCGRPAPGRVRALREPVVCALVAREPLQEPAVCALAACELCRSLQCAPCDRGGRDGGTGPMTAAGKRGDAGQVPERRQPQPRGRREQDGRVPPLPLLLRDRELHRARLRVGEAVGRVCGRLRAHLLRAPFPPRQYMISIDTHNDVLTMLAVRSACTS
jgi:hypothetical protein